MPTILVIDDNPAVATALETLFSLHDLDTRAVHTPEDGLALLARESIDLVVQDMNFHADTTSGEEGVALFAAIRERHPDLPVILLTAWTHLESAVDLVKAGAADYLAKPWDDRKLLATVNNLLELSEARRELARHRKGEQRRRSALERDYDLRGFVFADAASERVLAQQRIAPTAFAAAMALQFVARGRQFEQVVDRREQLAVVPGLGEVIGGAGLDQVDRGVQVRPRG